MQSMPPEGSRWPPSVVVPDIHLPHLYRDVVLPMWVLYDHPDDLPHYFALRLWDAMTNTATPFVFIAAELKDIEAQIDAIPGRFFRLSRHENDDAKILATYL